MGQKEREAVKAMYPKSKRWTAKVDKMSDSQVIAIYLSNQNRSKKEGDK